MPIPAQLQRRDLLKGFACGAVALAEAQAFGATAALPFANGQRQVVDQFPQKGEMLLLRQRPPLLETPFAVFDQGVLTPNNRFYVRWHLAAIPTTCDLTQFRLTVRGQVNAPLSLTVAQLLHDFPPYEIVAVNQCAGNSRGLFEPRVPGAQWGNGAMGNARWLGVRLRDVLTRSGVKAGAIQVRFRGLDQGILPGTPNFLKSLAVDHALDGEVMIAYAMNDEPLPLLNGFPLRLVVPGYFATYWVKMLTDIEVLAQADDNFWTAKAYLIPDTPRANAEPGQKVAAMVPIGRMVPRSFFTNLQDGATLEAATIKDLRGIAFGGASGVAKVAVSVDAGHSWKEAKLGQDYGKYSFRQWQLPVSLATRGTHQLVVKATNLAGVEQAAEAHWNASGYQRDVTEKLTVHVV